MKNALATALTFSFLFAACTNPNMDSVEATALHKGIYEGQLTTSDNPISHTTVLILMTDGNSAYTCTGSVLSPTIILTAAHCVTTIDSKTQKINTSEPYQISILDPAKVPAFSEGYHLTGGSRVLVHPAYLAQKVGANQTHYTVGYDLALIQLYGPLPDTYKPVVLSDDLNELAKNQIHIAGFGNSSLDMNADSDYKLRNGNVAIDLSERFIKSVASDEAARAEQIIPTLATNTTSAPNISFKKEASDSSICHGDSGGPLYFEKDGDIHLIGVNVAMFNTTGTPANCTTEVNGHELSVSLAGPQLRFILDSYKELTGTSLPLQRDVPEKDPNTFEFYLNSPVLSSKNSIVNLEGYSVAKDNRDNTLVILDNQKAATICEHPESINQLPGLVIYLSPASANVLDGKTIIPLLSTKDGIYQNLMEGRMKLEGDKVKTVVLTSDGYLSAEIPLITCNFPSAN